MKKLLIVAAMATSLLSVEAMAKTQGRYIGIHGIASKIDVADESTPTIRSGNGPYSSRRGLRIGFNYQHAFNLGNNIYIAPELFVDALETSSGRANQSSSDSVSVGLRYGAKANLGYDVTDETSVYVTAGYGEVEYESSKRPANGFSVVTSGSQGSMLYGIGINFKVSDTCNANIEINKQSVELPQGAGFTNYKADIDNIRFGIAHNF